MNLKLIFTLSLFGFLMAIATTFLIPSLIEPFFWAAIFIVCAYLIAEYADDFYFMHGFFTGIALFVWNTLIHVLLYTKFIFNHGPLAARMATLPKLGSPKILLLVIGLVTSVVAGFILGLLSLAASRVFRKRQAQ